MNNANKGFITAASAFAIWGIFPLYFHALQQVPAMQVIAQRIVWSCVFVLGWMYFRGELGSVRAALANRGVGESDHRPVRRLENDPMPFDKLQRGFAIHMRVHRITWTTSTQVPSDST